MNKTIKLIIILSAFSLMISGCTERNDETNPLTPESLSGDLRGQVLINEIYASGDPDWVELCNKSHKDIDLAGWWLSDDPDTNKKRLLDCDVIPAGGFFVIDLYSFRLNEDREEVFLSLPDGKRADSMDFRALCSDSSKGRYPDGSDNWMKMPPTPGMPNRSGN